MLRALVKLNHSKSICNPRKMASKYVLQKTRGRSQSGSNCSIIKLFEGGNGFHMYFIVYAMQSSEFTTSEFESSSVCSSLLEGLEDARGIIFHKYSNLICLRPAVISIKRSNCRSFNQLSDIARRHLKEHVSTKAFPFFPSQSIS